MKAILTYHSIDDSGSPISMPPSVFDTHLALFASGAIRVLGLDELLNHRDDGVPAAAITFDDGFSNVREAVERLGARGLPSTVFVVTDHVGRTNAWGGRASPAVPTLPLMTWDDLGRVLQGGARLGAHSRRHPPLTRRSTAEIADELLGSRQTMADRLGVVTEHVAYPYGDVDDRVASTARQYFRFGHTTDFRALRFEDDLMRLPRLDMYYFRGPGSLDRWGSAAFARRVAWCQTRRLVRTYVFRAGSSR